jgi:hypothetical protein
MTGIEGLAGRFQANSLAGADNQYAHDPYSQRKLETDTPDQEAMRLS